MTHTYRDALLYRESIGSNYEIDSEFTVYDSSTGKWYRTYFDLEMAFWASKYYSSGSLPDVKIEPTKPFKPLEPTFEVYKVPLVGIDINYQMNYNMYTLNKLWSDNNL